LEIQDIEKAHFLYPPDGWLLRARKRVKARIKQPRPRIPKRRYTSGLGLEGFFKAGLIASPRKGRKRARVWSENCPLFKPQKKASRLTHRLAATKKTHGR
jgi:hypothetical protein